MQFSYLGTYPVTYNRVLRIQMKREEKYRGIL